jgi:uncharacterized protein (TIGR02246 family)
MCSESLHGEIAAFIVRYNEVRNSHNAQDMAGFFNDNADLIGANGIVATGRDAIRNSLDREHSSVYRNSVAQRWTDSIRILRDDVAIVNGHFEVTGTRSTATDRPLAPKRGLFTLILTREQSEWRIDCYRSMIPTDVFGADPS